MRRARYTHIAAVAATAALALASCTATPQDGAEVVVSIEPLRWAAEQVLDSGVTVSTLVPRGGNPETYEPTAAEMMRVAGAKMFIHTGGLGFEQAWAARLQAHAPHTQFISLAPTPDEPPATTPIDSPATAPIEPRATVPVDSFDGLPPSPHDHHHSHDPHIWTSPRGMLAIVEKIQTATQQILNRNTNERKPQHKRTETATHRAEAAIHRADSLLHTVEQGSAFAIYHPSLTQLADDYGLIQVCIEAEGKEPTPSQLAATIDRCRELGVKVVFVQEEFDDRAARQIASQLGARVVHINPLGYDWPAEIEKIATALSN